MREEGEKSRITEWLSRFIIALSLLWGLWWLGIACYYSVPNAEDLAQANASKFIGLLPSVNNALTVYYTRFTSAFFYGCNILTLHWIRGYMWMPILCFGFLCLSFYFFISSLMPMQGNRIKVGLFCVAFFVLHFAMEPSLYYGLFYLSSTIDYMYPWVFLFLWTGFLIRVLKDENSFASLAAFFASVTFLILSFGCSELFIPINGLFLFALWLYTIRYSRVSWRLILSCSIVAASCFVFLLLCPSPKVSSGNIFADNNIRYPHSSFYAESLKAVAHLYFHYLLSPLSLLGILLACVLFRRWAVWSMVQGPFERTDLLFLFMLTVAGSYVASWVFFITKGNEGDFPVYIFDCISILAQIGLYLIFPLYVSAIDWPILNIGSKPGTLLVGSVLLLFCITRLDSNILLIKSDYDHGYLQDLKNKTERFYSDIDSVQSMGKGYKVVYFDNPDPIPASVFYGPDILPNRQSACWNIAYEQYFEIDEVRLKGDTIFK